MVVSGTPVQIWSVMKLDVRSRGAFPQATPGYVGTFRRFAGRARDRVAASHSNRRTAGILAAL
jgi:hypothetical protein